MSGSVWLGSNDHGGTVTISGDYETRTTMGATEHGGGFTVYGKGSDKTRATMGVIEYGNGVVNSWDKNGYRTGTLK